MARISFVRNKKLSHFSSRQTNLAKKFPISSPYYTRDQPYLYRTHSLEKTMAKSPSGACTARVYLLISCDACCTREIHAKKKRQVAVRMRGTHVEYHRDRSSSSSSSTSATVSRALPARLYATYCALSPSLFLSRTPPSGTSGILTLICIDARLHTHQYSERPENVCRGRDRARGCRFAYTGPPSH